jgi:hypothetical protein
MSRQEMGPGMTTTTPPPGTVVNEREPVTWEEMRALLRREPVMVERTWRPTTGGLLSVLAGSWNVLLGLGALLGGTFFSSLIAPLIPTFDFGSIITIASISTGGFYLVIGIISILGGASAMARRRWPLAIAGSILALIPTPFVLPFFMGIFSLIFNVLGHREFWAKSEGRIS